jgi:hypothetical protein
MRKLSVLLIAAACMLVAGSAQATLPSPANSVCVFEVKGNTCGDADGVWSPNGTLDTLCIRVTVNNALGDPLDTCDVRLDLSGTGDAFAAGNMAICGSAAGLLTLNATTDANGAASFNIFGGGCGRMELSWTVTAECASPEVVLCSDTTQVCMKSTDFNGDLMTNFLDTFQYLPQLSAGIGYCGDLNCNGNVNFLDTFQYLPQLSAGASCAGAALPGAALGTCP